MKAVNPTSKVIIHLSNGFDNGLFRYLFDGLAANNARYDVIGLSLYPSPADWPTLTAQCQANMNDMVGRYPGREVMLVETGMPANAPLPCRQMLLDLMAKTRAVPGGKGLRVLYWEPEAYNWMGYGLGAWAANGQPTAAMDAFRTSPPSDGLVNNPGFEYTAATQTPLGWSTATPTGDFDADYTQNSGRASLFRLTHQKATAYQVRTYQLISNLPSGTYNLSAWAQSSGGQTVCQLYANGFGGAEQRANIGYTSGNWVRMQVPNIVVTNGQCEIGLRSEAHAGESCSLDDVELVANQATAAIPSSFLSPDVQVFPNPAGQQFAVSYALGRAGTVRLAVYNLLGQPVLALPARWQAAGPHAETIALGNAAAGVYLLKININDQQIIRRFVKN